jgi:cystathionine beta-lyase/cystathionine gamma-synthase
MQTLRKGDHVISSDDLYGGSYRLFDKVYRPLGLDFTHVDTSDVSNVAAALRPETRYIFLETPTNPLMIVSDLAAISDLARSRGILTIVDNTYLSPVFQTPLNLGVDVVLHSSTKYLNGHSDMVGGVLVSSNDELAERLRFLQNASGAVPGPWDCWLALRGVKTLALRMERHNDNGSRIARFLNEHPRVKRVLYPGLAEHPQHEISRRQTRGSGGMVACDLGDLEAARSVLERTRVFALAESLGGVESLVSHPVTMTHASVPKEIRDSKGLTEGIVRFSAGIEDPEDLIEDLDRALGG